MSLNHAEIDLVISELDIEGCQIQKIIQPDFSSLIITLYKPWVKSDLLISLKQEKCRLNITEHQGEKPAKQQRFAQFLKARVSGGRVTGISQPGGERIVKLTIDRDSESTILWIRLWGSNANIIAVDKDMTILDLFYRRPGKNEITGAALVLPDNILNPDAKNTAEYKVRDFTCNPEKTRPFNSFIDDFYSAGEDTSDTEVLKEKISSGINKKISLLKASLNRISEELENTENYEKFMQYGNLILSGKYQIAEGDKWFKTENYLSDSSIVSIELDPDLTPEENAENYFKKYKKFKASGINLTGEKKNIEEKIAKLEDALSSLESITDAGELRKILSGAEIKSDKKVKEIIPGLQFSSGNYRILLGRTAAENDELLRHHVRGNDYWLHARDFPGGYVFIKYESGKSIPLETLIDAGNLALFFSKGRNSGRGEVYYTQVKYLRRAKGAKTGTVLPTQEKNLSIVLNDTILKKLLNRNSSDYLLF